MTTINSQEDFLNALAQNPQWRAAVRAQILGEELLQLPAAFQQFVATVSDFIREQKESNARQREFNDQQREINARVAQHLDSLEAGQGRMEQRLDSLEAGQERVERNLATLGGQVAVLSGSNFERVADRELRSILRYDMNLADPRALHRYNQEGSSPLEDMLYQAFTEGRIQRGELRDILRADMVYACGQDDQTIYLLAEASVTPQQRDFDRARRRSDLLSQAIGETVQALVVAMQELPVDTDINTRNVTFILVV